MPVKSNDINVVGKPSLKNLTRHDYGIPEEGLNEELQNLLKPHIESFNWFLCEGIKVLPLALQPIEIKAEGINSNLTIKCVEVLVDNPKIHESQGPLRNIKLFPSHCRQLSTTYNATVCGKFSISVDGIQKGIITRVVGSIPIMVNSVGCNLHGLTPEKLIKHQEEENSVGGYFIINGLEKIIRMIELTRRNYPLTMSRPHFKKRGKHFSEYAIYVRSVAKSQLTRQIWLHYLNNGTCSICIMHKKSTYIFPLMMIIKAFVDKTDIEIYKEMICTKEKDSYFTSCIQNMLRQLKSFKFTNTQSVLKYIGELFSHKLPYPEWLSDEKRGEMFLKENILIHLENNEDKVRMLYCMTRKVFDFALLKCFPDGLDSVQVAELLLPGHLFQVYLIEKLDIWNIHLSRIIQKKINQNAAPGFNISFVHSCMSVVPDITSAFTTTMATGKINARDTLGIPQNNGLCILADRLNFLRYISHFRAVHKGARFTEMRDTKCRRLTADSWGFLCPVHTPDGAPCGLLNHLAHLCEVVTHPVPTDGIFCFLFEHGMLAPDSSEVLGCTSGRYYFVLLDGCVIGWIHSKIASKVEKELRVNKAQASSNIPLSLEICLIPYSNRPTQYPGFYLFTEQARMIRPVFQICSGNVEMIGTFEQMYMDICVIPEEAHDCTTHQEITQHSILSAIASLTPFSDHNQSPRNMYQCQMAKQTMGHCCNTFKFRCDTKLYRLITPQTPIVRPYMYDHYKIDDYCLGTNAVVAVISYTGYDMEDAMVISKGSFDRGFCSGTIYKTEIIDLNQLGHNRFGPVTFGCNPGSPEMNDYSLGRDGLPNVGQRLDPNCQYYSFVNHSNLKMTVVTYKESETAYVDNIKILCRDKGPEEFNRVGITLRIPRNPMIGDKFASRHGQKGICSRLWPVESLPFTESGMVPDIIFNPHGFPSRMTIGMMIESMAGKAAAVNGDCYDATPFTFTEDDTAIDYFGKLLTKAGFNYYGTETMYSGVSGLQLEAEIFFGIVYYQRLRHMVSDKFQVRTTGPVDAITQQPVKGRKLGGGIRFGEMERDALLSHGAAMLLHDRLMVNSDMTQSYVCEKCKSLLSPTLQCDSNNEKRWLCRLCKSDEYLSLINIPHVFRYLCHELAVMNIKLELTLE